MPDQKKVEVERLKQKQARGEQLTPEEQEKVTEADEAEGQPA